MSKNGQFHIPPNPVSDIIHLNSTFTINTLTIISLEGTIVSTQESSSGITSIDVNHLSKGSYLMIASDVAGQGNIVRFQKI